MCLAAYLRAGASQGGQVCIPRKGAGPIKQEIGFISVIGRKEWSDKPKLQKLAGPRYVAVLLLSVSILISLFSAVLAGPGPALYDSLEKFHGDACAGSVFGARLGFAAAEAMGKHGKLKAQYFDLSCPVDGIQLSTGATYGNRGLEVLDQDDHRLVLTDTDSGKKVEARLTEQALEQGRRIREISAKLRSIDVESDEAVALKNDKESALDWLKTAPDSLVVTIEITE